MIPPDRITGLRDSIAWLLWLRSRENVFVWGDSCSWSRGPAARNSEMPYSVRREKHVAEVREYMHRTGYMAKWRERHSQEPRQPKDRK